MSHYEGICMVEGQNQTWDQEDDRQVRQNVQDQQNYSFEDQNKTK